jgi:hypothetical protein
MIVRDSQWWVFFAPPQVMGIFEGAAEIFPKHVLE